MKTLSRIKVGLITVGTLLLMTSATRALADQAGPYYATPSWDQQIPAATRFIVLSNWGGAAVLDRETGLVWEKTPNTATGTPAEANARCINKVVGGRAGWKLPSIQDLRSLYEFDGTTLHLPVGHPFIVSPAYYWSSTKGSSALYWYIDLSNGDANLAPTFRPFQFWCVRGGAGVDVQEG